MTFEKKLMIYDRVLGTISAFAIIVGGIWTLLGYIDAKNKENELRLEQMKTSIFNEKKALYYDLSDSEAEIAACNSYEEVLSAQIHFRKLYVGRAHIISKLDTDVNNQKIAFGDLLDSYLKNKPGIKPFDYFGSASLELVDICKKNLNLDSIYR
jgi:hypothetical protein